MKYLLDTSVALEFVKRDHCDPAFETWLAGVKEQDLFLSVLVLGEIRKTVGLIRKDDPIKAKKLQKWSNELSIDFRDRILPIDDDVAIEWGRLSALRGVPPIDILQIATANVHQLTLVTQHISHLFELGIYVVDPFEP